MPLYEYRCNECDQEFEKMVSFSEANQTPPCPVCNSTQTQKKISRVVSFGSSASGGSTSSGSSCSSTGRFR